MARANIYDLIVFDTAPTGHTLQLLRMPEAITTGFRCWCATAAPWSRSLA